MNQIHPLLMKYYGTFIFTSIILLFASGSFAQINSDFWGKIPSGISLTFTPVEKKLSPGVEMELLFPLSSRFLTGLCINGTMRQTDNNYGAALAQPAIEIYDLCWLNVFDIVWRSKYRISAILSTGWSNVNYIDLNTSNGGFWAGMFFINNYVTYKKNDYLVLKPGMSVVLGIGHSTYAKINASYRFMIGSSEFSSAGQFSGPMFAAGFGVRFGR